MLQNVNGKNACVLIVEQDIDFGIRLADWLASRGYQAVLLRSVENALNEVWDIHPQAILVGLTTAALSAQVTLFKLLHVIQSIDPHIPVMTMGDEAVENATDIMIRQAVRRFLAKPFELALVDDVLHSELHPATTAVAV